MSPTDRQQVQERLPHRQITRTGRTDMSAYTVRTASWQEDRRALQAVREVVFIGEQGVPVELEWDEFDVVCMHLLATDSSGNPIGTARLLPDASIGRMAVLRDWRCKGVGRALMHQLLKEAENRQLPTVTLSAQTHAIGFYSRFGFQQIGLEFLDAGIPHVKMVLRLHSSANNPGSLLAGPSLLKGEIPPLSPFRH